MENYDRHSSLDGKESKMGCSKRASGITSDTSTAASASSISAIVTLHQSRSDALPSTRVHQTGRNQLIGILTESSANRIVDGATSGGGGASTTRRKTICMEPRLNRGAVGNVVQVQLQRGVTSSITGGASVSSSGGKPSIVGGHPAPGKQKIPRPANAFMLFANEWRKKLAVENPRESNKDISVRLGVLWKNMAKDIKEKYFALAREVDAEHKRKYPDYVYNPKEARLRKAMREQSRELSRQSILQTAIASATGNTSGVGNGSQPVTGSTNFLNHPLNCPPSAAAAASVAAAAVSSLPGSPSFNTGNRIINPWFPAGHPPTANHLKPILSPRVMTVAQHQQQQQQQQQQTFDKTKEVLRKQAECVAGGAAFSAASAAGYPSEFTGHGNTSNVAGPGRSSSAHESNDYCVIAEFSEGQKWHPYQNGPAAYHSRGGGPLTKMGALHPGMSSGNPHAHGGWNQFCAMPLSTPTLNRAPRHMVFLQGQQQNQHCGFPDDMQIPYMQNKHMEINHRLHPSYAQQAKLQSSSMSPINMSQLQEPEKCIEDGPRWESAGAGGSGGGEGSMGAMVSGHSRRDSELQLHQEQREQEHDQSTARDSRQQQQQQQHRERDREQQQHYSDSGSSSEAKHQRTVSSKQPLPGFHQAFGSTEIGRFSRSEFFANMVGESGNLIPDGFLPASIFPFSPTSQIGLCPTNPVAMPHRSLTTDEELLQQILPDDCFWLAPGIPAIPSLADSASSYAAFLDYSHRLSQQDWLHPVNSIPQDIQSALMDQPGGAFIFHENNCTLLGSRQDRRNYSESSCGSSSPGSTNYSRDGARDRRTPNESSALGANEAGEPENLSSRNPQEDSLIVEKSTTPKESDDETDISNS